MNTLEQYEIKKETLSNGNTITYKVINGTYYHAETEDKICKILENARQSRKRLKIYFGDAKTGRDWNEEHDTIGYIGRSTGTIKIPLLIYNNRSLGGGAILDHCIVKIKESNTGKVLYENVNYSAPQLEIKESSEKGYTHSLYVNGTLYSNHKSFKSAEILKNKLS